jgi:hypothetical protein
VPRHGQVLGRSFSAAQRHPRFLKLESQKLELEAIPFSVLDLVDDALKPLALMAHSKGLELIADVAADVPGISGDPGRIGQIITNLVGNAIKFTAHGHVVLQVRCEQRLLDQAQLHFSVSDTGIGIPADKRDDLQASTRPTDRRRAARRLARPDHFLDYGAPDGRDDLVERARAARSLHRDVPIAELRAPAYQPVLTLPVLIVDDNEINRRIFHDMLTRWAMRPTAVASGAAALQALADASRSATRCYGPARRQHARHGRLAVAERMAAHPELGSATIMMLTLGPVRRFDSAARAGHPRLPHRRPSRPICSPRFHAPCRRIRRARARRCGSTRARRRCGARASCWPKTTSSTSGSRSGC